MAFPNFRIALVAGLMIGVALAADPKPDESSKASTTFEKRPF